MSWKPRHPLAKSRLRKSHSTKRPKPIPHLAPARRRRTRRRRPLRPEPQRPQYPARRPQSAQGGENCRPAAFSQQKRRHYGNPSRSDAGAACRKRRRARQHRHQTRGRLRRRAGRGRRGYRSRRRSRRGPFRRRSGNARSARTSRLSRRRPSRWRECRPRGRARPRNRPHRGERP